MTRLTLTRFRCYEGARLNADTRPVVLTGPNGCKTNLLEAVSFLSPGRGLRRAKLADVERIGGADGGPAGCGVAARVETRSAQWISAPDETSQPKALGTASVRIDGHPFGARSPLPSTSP